MHSDSICWFTHFYSIVMPSVGCSFLRDRMAVLRSSLGGEIGAVNIKDRTGPSLSDQRALLEVPGKFLGHLQKMYMVIQLAWKVLGSDAIQYSSLLFITVIVYWLLQKLTWKLKQVPKHHFLLNLSHLEACKILTHTHVM